jgi:crotonobetainyl-CoA:carnitine CoA-transferase CaiB-like acyl-CoA transferase
LADVTVLDLGQIYNGPYATLLMALAGARVIKIEPPTGEHNRSGRSQVRGIGADLPFHIMNSNKLGVTLNLKSDQGVELFRTMARKADVVIENYRPGVMRRLGIDAESLRRDNPALVYASSTGYGQEGRYRDLAAMDLTVQAMAGVMASTGFPDNPPVKAGPAIGDFLAGIHLYAAVVTALYRRRHTGEGAVVDVAMIDSIYPSLMSNIAMRLGAGEDAPPRTGNRHGGQACAPYNVYATDSGYVAIIVTSERHWKAIAGLLDGDGITTDIELGSMPARVANIDLVDDLVTRWTSRRSTADAFAALRHLGVPAAPVRGLGEVIGDDYFRERGFLVDLDIPDVGTVPALHSPLRFAGEQRIPLVPTPTLGQHNETIYCDWLGLPRRRLRELHSDGVI